jgi:hypothetical protein
MFLQVIALLAILVSAIPVSAALPGNVKDAPSDARWHKDHDFRNDIAAAQKILAQHTAGFTVAKRRLQSFNILLAVKKDANPIELVSMSRSGANRKGFAIDWEKNNGVNTPFMVTKPEGYVLLAIRRVVKSSSGYKEVIYTPYTADIDTPTMRVVGMQYLRDTLDNAFRELRRKRVMSKVTPKHTIADVMPADVALLLSIIEHIDPSRLKNEEIEWLVNEVLVVMAANGAHAYNYSVSRTGARGLFQFMPGTYGRIVKQYPRAELNADFVLGMNNHLNAAQASLLLFDSDYAFLSREARATLSKRTLAEYLAAAYNCGAPKSARSYGRGGDWHSRLPEETRWYLRKLDLAAKALGMRW